MGSAACRCRWPERTRSVNRQLSRSAAGHGEAVAGRVLDQRAGIAEGPPQPGDQRLQGVGAAARRIVLPDRVDQLGRGDQAALGHRQPHEQRPEPTTGDRSSLAGHSDLQRSEQVDAHTAIVWPATQPSVQPLQRLCEIDHPGGELTRKTPVGRVALRGLCRWVGLGLPPWRLSTLTVAQKAARSSVVLKAVMAVSWADHDRLSARPHVRQPQGLRRARSPSTTTPTTCARSASRSCRTGVLLWIIRVVLLIGDPGPRRTRRSAVAPSHEAPRRGQALPHDQGQDAVSSARTPRSPCAGAASSSCCSSSTTCCT